MLRPVIYFIFLFLLVFTTGCEDININLKSKYYDDRLELMNNSTSSIVAYLSFAYPDTSLSSTSPAKNIYANSDQAAPGEKINFVRGGTWEHAFEEQIPGGKMIIFIIEESTFENTEWNSIVSNYDILKRYDLSLDDLKEMNWKIEYQ